MRAASTVGHLLLKKEEVIFSEGGVIQRANKDKEMIVWQVYMTSYSKT